MDSHVLAYLAGLTDGEGCITIVKNIKRTKKGSMTTFKYPKFTAVFTVGLTDQPTIELFHKTFGGSIYVKPAKANRKQAWYWRAETKTLEQCIAHLLPYLRLKRKQARLLQRFRTHIHNPITASEIARRDVLHRLMKRLNHPS